MSLTLSDAELREITARQRSPAQARALTALGIPYRKRHDGSLAVLRAAAEAALGGQATMAHREPALQP